MWKRWAIRIAAAYLERIFDKWMRNKSDGERERVDELLDDFAKYLRSHRSSTAQLVSQILENWRD